MQPFAQSVGMRWSRGQRRLPAEKSSLRWEADERQTVASVFAKSMIPSPLTWGWCDTLYGACSTESSVRALSVLFDSFFRQNLTQIVFESPPNFFSQPPPPQFPSHIVPPNEFKRLVRSRGFDASQ